METERINDLREIRKLISILHTHGNIIVPSLPGQSETTAQERLMYFLAKLEQEGLSPEDIEQGINLLPEYGY